MEEYPTQLRRSSLLGFQRANTVARSTSNRAKRTEADAIKVPVTAFVRFTEPVRGVLEDKIEGHIEVYAADETTTVRVGERDVPLEFEPSATLAYALEGAKVWDFELAGVSLCRRGSIR